MSDEWLTTSMENYGSRQEYQRSILLELLARPYWSHKEAAWIITGVVPELTLGEDGWFVLPGLTYPRPERLADFHDEITRTISRLRQRLLKVKNKGGMPPSDVISLAIALKESPPWLDIAKGDKACASLLPQSAFRSAPGNGLSSSRMAQQKRRIEQHAESDMTKLINGAAKQEFDRIRAVNYSGFLKKSGDPNVAKIAKALRETIQEFEPAEESLWPDERTLRTYIKKWF